MLKVKKLHPGAKLPTRAYDKALAYDVYFCPQDGKSEFLYSCTCPRQLCTGIVIEPPEGYGYIVKERGSMGLQGLAIRAGVVDEDYRGELIVLMQRISPRPDLNLSALEIKPGDKIAQIILIPTPTVEVVEVDELSETKRGDKKLGSSGR